MVEGEMSTSRFTQWFLSEIVRTGRCQNKFLDGKRSEVLQNSVNYARNCLMIQKKIKLHEHRHAGCLNQEASAVFQSALSSVPVK